MFYELEARYDNQKSFYGKAMVTINRDWHYLYSYGTHVASFNKNTGVFVFKGQYSVTTSRHINEFFRQCTGYSIQRAIDRINDALGKNLLKRPKDAQDKINRINLIKGVVKLHDRAQFTL